MGSCSRIVVVVSHLHRVREGREPVCPADSRGIDMSWYVSTIDRLVVCLPSVAVWSRNLQILNMQKVIGRWYGRAAR